MWTTLLSYVTKKVALVAFAIAAVLSLYFYVAYLRTTIKTLEQEKVVLELAIQEQQKTIDVLKKSYDKIIQSKDDMNKKAKELEKQNDELRETLFREQEGKLSLEELILLDKKGRIQRLINKATDKVLRCFEVLSGAPLKENEKLECK